MKKPQINFYNLYLYSVGVLWIILIIYLRFLRKRSEYTLSNLKSNMTDYTIYANIAFIILHIIIIIFALYLLKKRKNEQVSNNALFTKLQNIFDKVFIKPLESIRDLIAANIKGSGIFYSKVCHFLEINVKLRPKMLVILFYIIPRIILAFIFFVEIIFYNQIRIFIYSLFILIIPLTWILFVNLFTDFGERCLKDIPKNVQVIGVGELLSYGFYKTYEFKPLPQFSYEDGELKEWADTWFMALHSYVFGKYYLKGYKSMIGPYLTILTSTLYLSAGFYKLSFILFN